MLLKFMKNMEIDISRIRDALLEDEDFLRGFAIKVAKQKPLQELILKSVIPNVATKNDLKDLETRLKNDIIHYIDKRLDDTRNYIDKRLDDMRNYIDKRLDDIRKLIIATSTILAILLSALIGIQLV